MTYYDYSTNKSLSQWPCDPVLAPKPPTNERMIEDILACKELEDEGFFLDIVEWLRKDAAPRKLRGVLQELHFLKDIYPVSASSVDLSYERLCELVYNVGFRASEVLKNRMILGDSNVFVKKYFEDFPL